MTELRIKPSSLSLHIPFMVFPECLLPQIPICDQSLSTTRNIWVSSMPPGIKLRIIVICLSIPAPNKWCLVFTSKKMQTNEWTREPIVHQEWTFLFSLLLENAMQTAFSFWTLLGHARNTFNCFAKGKTERNDILFIITPVSTLSYCLTFCLDWKSHVKVGVGWWWMPSNISAEDFTHAVPHFFKGK